MSPEIWVTLTPLHEVSNFGRVRNLKRRMMLPSTDRLASPPNQYITATIGGRKTTVHRVIAETFLPNPDRLPEVNHLNGIKGDNRVSNLEWSSHADNIKHAYDTGLGCHINPATGVGYTAGTTLSDEAKQAMSAAHLAKGDQHHRVKLTATQVAEILVKREAGALLKTLALEYGVTAATISNLSNGKRRKPLTA